MRLKLASYADRTPEMYKIITGALKKGNKIELSFRDLDQGQAMSASAPFKALYLQYRPSEIARYMGVPKMDLNQREQAAKAIWYAEISKIKELSEGTRELVEICNEINAIPHDFVGDLHDAMVKESDVDGMMLLSDNTGITITYTRTDLKEFTSQGFSYRNKKSTPVTKPYPVGKRPMPL